MRASIRPLSFVLAAGVMSGCSSTDDKRGATAAPAATQPTAAAAGVMSSGGVAVLRLTAPADVKCAAADGSLHFTAPHYELEVWLARGASTVDDAVGFVGPQIATEFEDFKPTTTTDLTVAGSPAKRLVGTGHEADDGDDGGADVIVFKVGDHVFVACTHDEELNPAAQQGLLTLVRTAQTP